MRHWARKYDVIEIPEDLVEKAQEYRDHMIEAISEHDEALMHKFIEGEAITTMNSAPVSAKRPSRCRSSR